MIAVCALGFWIIPAGRAQRQDRERLLAALGVLGVVVALSIYFVSVAGGLTGCGRAGGFYKVGDLTLAGRATGIHFGYSSGAYITPLEPSILTVIGIVALLGWSSGRALRDARLAWIAIIFMIPAVLVTLDRSAWLAAAVGGGGFTVLAYAAKVRVAAGGFLVVFLNALFLLGFGKPVGGQTGSSACYVDITVGHAE